MALMTVNETMALQKAVRERLGELKRLRDEVAVKRTTTWMDRDNDKKEDIEPQYDVKAVDKKITELELFLFQADSRVKQSNALTKIEIEASVEKLLAPLS